MAEYTVIADVSKSIIEAIKDGMIPEPIKNAELIGVCPPNDRGNIKIGIYLYNFDENPEPHSQSKIFLDKEHYKDPPMSLNLYYMLYAYSDAELMNRSYEEQRILGRAMQQLSDNRRLQTKYLCGELINGDLPDEKQRSVDIQMINLTLEEKVRIWSLFNQPYKSSAFYKVGPVFIDSRRVRSTKRVTEVEVHLKQK